MRAEPQLIDAATRVARVQWHYARRGLGLAEAALAGAARCEALRHYPAGDVLWRPATGGPGCQFYYHAHASRRRPSAEHGHFHLFVRPDATEPADFFHLAALSLDARGQPLRWFTTNRWVTNERWRPAPLAIAALAGFELRTRGRLAPVADWLDAMVRLYRPTLAALLRRRDALLAGRTDLEALFEDRRLDVISQSRVDLPARLHRIAQAAA